MESDFVLIIKGDLEGLCEIDPLLSYEGEGLEEVALKLKGQKVRLPLYIK